MSVTSAFARVRAMPILLILLLATAACTTANQDPGGLDPERQQMAFMEAKSLRDQGKRVWCVPYARNLSGIQIRGNAGTWWNQATDKFARGHEPKIGAVMAFSSTGKLPMGHVAVVSGIVNERQVLLDHANWERNKISLNMAAVDVSEKNDWSSVRVESVKGSLGRIYPIDGFIYPDYNKKK